MSAALPFYVGAWRRRSIAVPGGLPVEPCEAWWLQAGDAFVDVRVVLPGQAANELPYSATRVFAGWFAIDDGHPCWHVELDSAGSVPRTDRGSAGGLYVDRAQPSLMIEDAPGRFREEWTQRAPGIDAGDIESMRSEQMIAVRIGAISGVVQRVDGMVCGWVWDGQRSVGFGPS